MPSLKIQGRVYQVAPLSEIDRCRFFMMVAKEVRKLDREATPDVFLEVTSQIDSVKQLVSWACVGPGPLVNADNALDILTALLPYVDPQLIKLAGDAALEKLRECV